jgi:hypothetical protein
MLLTCTRLKKIFGLYHHLQHTITGKERVPEQSVMPMRSVRVGSSRAVCVI